MNIVLMQVFVSLALVAGALVLFLHSVRSHDFEHADRLSLAPLEDDTHPSPPTQPAQPSRPPDPESPCKQDESNTTTP